MTVVELGTARAYSDVVAFVGRARRVAPDGALRLQTAGRDLILLTVGVLAGEGLSGSGAVTAMRAVRGSCDTELDAVVSFASLADRFARADSTTTSLPVPPTTVSAPWAGVSPPRDGWEPRGELTVDELKDVARQVVSQVADIVGSSAGSAAIDSARRGVWARPTDGAPSVPAGMAFAADALGFLTSEPGDHAGAPARVMRAGRWTRLSTAYGHVLHRS